MTTNDFKIDFATYKNSTASSILGKILDFQKQIVVIICLLTISCSSDDPQITREASWKKITYPIFPTLAGRLNPLSFVENDTLFYGLGAYPHNIEIEMFFSDIWFYTAEKWGGRISFFPGRVRTDEIMFSLNGKIYVGLGTDYRESFKDLWEYDMIEKSWDSLSFVYPGEKVDGSITFKTSDKIYYGAGRTSQVDYSSDMYAFDPKDGWQHFFAERQFSPTIFKLKDEVYSCFGTNDEGYLNTVRKFNETDQRWENVCIFKEEEYPYIARTGAQVFVINESEGEFVYIIGGKPDPKISAEEFWQYCRYNPRSKRLEKVNITNIPERTRDQQVFSVNNIGHIFDGVNMWQFIP